MTLEGQGSKIFSFSLGNCIEFFWIFEKILLCCVLRKNNWNWKKSWSFCKCSFFRLFDFRKKLKIFRQRLVFSSWKKFRVFYFMTLFARHGKLLSVVVAACWCFWLVKKNWIDNCVSVLSPIAYDWSQAKKHKRWPSWTLKEKNTSLKRSIANASVESINW